MTNAAAEVLPTVPANQSDTNKNGSSTCHGQLCNDASLVEHIVLQNMDHTKNCSWGSNYFSKIGSRGATCFGPGAMTGQ